MRTETNIEKNGLYVSPRSIVVKIDTGAIICCSGGDGIANDENNSGNIGGMPFED